MNRGSNGSFSEPSDKREPLIVGKFPETQLVPAAEWPDVFEEAKAMLLSAILIYGVMDLRALARKYKGSSNEDDGNKIDGFLVERLLTLPISAQDIVTHVGKHRATIQQEIGSESTDLYLDAFDAIQKNNSTAEDLELEFNAASGRVSLVSFDVVVAEDQCADKELVYAICVDTSRRRITVIFRGCSTQKDWRICASNFLKVQDNPLFTPDGDQPDKIGIHSGYCKYLFNTDTHDGISKFEAIMTQLQRLLISYPGYQIYITGHSLGAALATVFAFQAAASEHLDGSHVLTCINFASPMVGNLAFETAFRELEAKGRIRCLRVTNHFDIFTQLPDRGSWLYVLFCCCGVHLVAYAGWSLLFYLCWQSNVYRHVGMDLHMYDKEGNYKLKHPSGSSKNYAWRVAQDWKKHFKQTFQRMMMLPFVFRFDTNHSVQEHLKRLTGMSSQLKGVFLTDLYATKRFPNQHSTQMESELV